MIRLAGAAWLRPRLAGVEIRFGQAVASAAPSKGSVRLRLKDGSGRTADHVLLGTGYRVDIRRHGFLDQELASAVRTVNGYKVLSRFFESSIGGLSFLGPWPR